MGSRDQEDSCEEPRAWLGVQLGPEHPLTLFAPLERTELPKGSASPDLHENHKTAFLLKSSNVFYFCKTTLEGLGKEKLMG